MKLQAAPMATATLGFNDLVPMAVAIALDASVAPFTKIDPITRTVMTKRTGFVIRTLMKVPNDIMYFLPIQKTRSSMPKWDRTAGLVV